MHHKPDRRSRADADSPSAPSLREKIADSIDISKEVILDTVLLTMIGEREMTVENYKSIITYTDTKIKLKAKPYPVEIIGTGLEIRSLTRELLYITGRIRSFSYLADG